MQVQGARGTYVLHHRLGTGALFEDWLATGEGRREVLVVKRLLPALAAEASFREMLEHEARLTALFDFPGVVRTLDAGEDFLVLPHLPGTTLGALWAEFERRGELLPLPLACGLMARFSTALDQVHSLAAAGKPLQVVHREVSPQALQLGFDGQVRIADFTLAKSALRRSETQPGVIKGRFPYLSPENVRGLPIDRRSDVFSLAVCVWELLSGQRLFQGNSDFASLEKVRACVVPPLPRQVPAALEAAVREALAKDAEDRTPSAGALAHALAPFAHGSASDALAALLRARFPAELASAQAQVRRLTDPLAGLDALIRGTPHDGNSG